LAVRAESGNRFVPVQVKIGPYQFGDSFPISQGLKEGDRVTTSANFLLNSESRQRFDGAGGMASMPGMDMGGVRGGQVYGSSVASAAESPVPTIWPPRCSTVWAFRSNARSATVRAGRCPCATANPCCGCFDREKKCTNRSASGYYIVEARSDGQRKGVSWRSLKQEAFCIICVKRCCAATARA
jgi:hypothetical protein